MADWTVVSDATQIDYFTQGHGGIVKVIIDGESASLGMGNMMPEDVQIPHRHPNEQMGYCISGECELIVDGVKYIAKSPGTYYIPANKPHSWLNTSNEDFHYIDVFTPPREDLTKGKFDTSLYTK